MISVQQVEKFDSIQVHGVKDLTRPYLELYFENTRHGGGVIKTMTMCQDEDCCIIQFEDSKSKCCLNQEAFVHPKTVTHFLVNTYDTISSHRLHHDL